MYFFDKSKFFAFLLTGILTISGNAVAWDNVRLYPVYWSGINVGELIIHVNGQGDVYKVRTIINSRNIARTVSGYYNDAEATAIVKNGKIIPKEFKTELHLKWKKRNIEIDYDDKGNIVRDYNVPPEKREKRPAVPPELKNGSYNPLAMAILMREKIRAYRNSGTLDEAPFDFTIPLYDGRRRSDINFTVHGRKTINIKGRNIDIIHLSFINEAVAGYTKNELRDMPTQNPIINIYIEDNDQLLPVKGDGETRIGFATGYLTKECTSLDDCDIDLRGKQ